MGSGKRLHQEYQKKNAQQYDFGRSRLPTDTSSSGSSSPGFIPPGVLKKPGSCRREGPKGLKKVAFLENAEFSRGIP